VAFYSLSSDRFCIAASHHAGAEHSGRGGQRVYTHNVIVSGDDLAKCGFNPFTIIRAPRLKIRPNCLQREHCPRWSCKSLPTPLPG
jgi:hypothetical protein